MSKNKKFNPEITRIKLNPEQAVLACSCYSSSHKGTLHQDKFHENTSQWLKHVCSISLPKARTTVAHAAVAKKTMVLHTPPGWQFMNHPSSSSS